MQITAAVMEKADGVVTRRNIKLEKVELEDPREDEVLIRVTSCGVCGTDKGVIYGLEPFPTPGVLGHEGAGIVEAVGSNLVAEAVEALGIRGTCAMVGGAKMTASVTFNHPGVLLKGKRIIGVMGGGQTPMFLESLMLLQRDGRFPLEKLVKFYDFADINQAIDDSDGGKTIKPVIRMR